MDLKFMAKFHSESTVFSVTVVYGKVLTFGHSAMDYLVKY